MRSISLDPTTEDAFAVLDARFRDVLGDEPRLVKVADVDAHEGPTYADGALYFTTLPRGGVVSIARLDLDGLEATGVAVVRASANAANGMTLAPDGRLPVCEPGSLDEP